jgi:hypothetical protein
VELVVVVVARDIVVVGIVDAVPDDNVPKVPIDDEKNGAVVVVVETFIPDDDNGANVTCAFTW